MSLPGAAGMRRWHACVGMTFLKQKGSGRDNRQFVCCLGKERGHGIEEICRMSRPDPFCSFKAVCEAVRRFRHLLEADWAVALALDRDSNLLKIHANTQHRDEIWIMEMRPQFLF